MEKEVSMMGYMMSGKPRSQMMRKSGKAMVSPVSKSIRKMRLERAKKRK